MTTRPHGTPFFLKLLPAQTKNDAGKGAAARGRVAMIRCRLDQVQVGAVLGSPVRNEQGAVLVQSGVALDERVLCHLRALKIRTVYLMADPTSRRGSAADQAARERVAQRERARFGEIDADPVMVALRDAVIEIKLAQALVPSPAAGATGSGDAEADGASDA